MFHQKCKTSQKVFVKLSQTWVNIFAISKQFCSKHFVIKTEKNTYYFTNPSLTLQTSMLNYEIYITNTMKKKYWNSVHKTGCHKKRAIFSFLFTTSVTDFNLKTLEIFFLLNFKSQKFTITISLLAE